MPEPPINFYFLSSGYCGTRFFHHVLRLARNAEVWHQPGHEDIATIVDLLEERFLEDPGAFFQTELTEFPVLRRRIDKRLRLPWAYGDTLNWMRGLGQTLHRYVGPRRLRLVQLIRHPVATCRSILAETVRPLGSATSDLTLARETARSWVRQYSWIQAQFDRIDDDRVCRTIRLEDTSVQRVRELYDFLGLDGFDATAVERALTDTSPDMRHYHASDARVPASQEELRAIWKECAPLAEFYGYVEHEALYAHAPSRPASTAPPTRSQVNDGSLSPARVKLLGPGGLGLIIPQPSGIEYISQAGGPVCFWLRAEGTFVPLNDAAGGSPAQGLLDHFLLRRDKAFMRAIDAADADVIEAILDSFRLDAVRVDRSRLGRWRNFDPSTWETWDRRELQASPWEAWVPVRIGRRRYSRVDGVLSGFEGEAILVWENSN